MAYTGDEYEFNTNKGADYAGLSQTQYESFQITKLGQILDYISKEN